jgi:HD superfamily phosphohydrolase
LKSACRRRAIRNTAAIIWRMRDFQQESLSLDPIHGYIPFVAAAGLPEGETSEQHLIDHPWLQRLRQIHQLQTAWWVFPGAEHTRFQHALGAMYLASRAIGRWYDSLQAVCPDVPSRPYVESLLRLAALLHDVGHGPFGHFFDVHYLADFGLTHETLGCEIIRRDLAPIIRRIRRNPSGVLRADEQLDPEQIAYLITRPKEQTGDDAPHWLRLLRAMFCGLYTVDNMDFVLRDAYMSGYSLRAFDLDRLLHYSMFTRRGLTIHERGLPALVRFISVRAELFRAIYFHRTVRALDLALQDLFAESKPYLFPGNPREHLEQYQQFTEWSLLMDVSRWPDSSDARLRELGMRWRQFLSRRIQWKMACERTIFFAPGESELGTVFANEQTFEAAVRDLLPAELKNIPMRVDTARHVHRPSTQMPSAGQNFLYEPATGRIRDLDARELYRRIAISFRICRVYVQDPRHSAAIAEAMDKLTGTCAPDDLTNM